MALRGVDLDVDAGQIVSLLGKNGAGKTTLLSIIAGLLQPDAGSVQIADVDALRSPEAASRLIGIAPQETGIYPVLTVEENLQFFAELAGLGRSVRTTRVHDVAEQLGLSHLLARRANALSGGEARRLHTGCALLHRPNLLMLDEPTVGADVETRAQLITAVQQLASDGAAVIYTTHYLPEVEALDADVVIIDDGSILAVGSQESLIDEHSLVGLRVRCDDPIPAALAAFQPISVGEGVHRIEQQLSMAELLRALGQEADRLHSVEQLRPDLETVFLSVTGKRLDGGEETPAAAAPGGVSSDGEASP